MDGRGHGHLIYHHHQQQQHQLQQISNVGSSVQLLEDRDQRLPQWSQIETREFLAIRAEMDQSFMETKRNKLLWDLISTRMREKGFARTPDQCKCKWKNLVTRYKGNESMDSPAEMPTTSNRQFPYQEEMKAIFATRMERLLNFQEGKKEQHIHVWSEEEEEGEEQPEAAEASNKKRKTLGGRVRGGGGTVRVNVEEVKKAMRGFVEWQMQMEAQWMEATEAREAERKAAEEEWRRVMMTITERRVEMQRRWREREEERRVREEERAERRHQLVVAVLTKLSNDDMY